MACRIRRLPELLMMKLDSELGSRGTPFLSQDTTLALGLPLGG